MTENKAWFVAAMCVCLAVPTGCGGEPAPEPAPAAERAGPTGLAAEVRQDWAQFQGPNRDGTSPETGLLKAWPEGGPKVLWTIDVGRGFGGAAVRDGEVYLLDRDVPPRDDASAGRDILRCFDLASGEERWRDAYDAPGRVGHSGSRQVPSVTKKWVYAVGPYGHVHCWDRRSHEVVWETNLVTEYGAKVLRWALAQSPVFYEDTLILAPLSDEVGVVALDGATGQERWRTGPLGPLGYASPTLLRIGGLAQLVVQTKREVVAVRPDDGELLWRHGFGCQWPIPMPTLVGEDRVFVTGGYGAGSTMIRVRRAAGGFTTETLWRDELIGSQIQQPMVVGGHVYAVCNTNDRGDGMACFAADDGEVRWRTAREPYLDKGNTVLTGDGVFYQVDGKSGELYAIDPSPAAFKALDKVELLSGREIWAPMALDEGRLIVRDQSKMMCLDVNAR